MSRAGIKLHLSTVFDFSAGRPNFSYQPSLSKFYYHLYPKLLGFRGTENTVETDYVF